MEQSGQLVRPITSRSRGSNPALAMKFLNFIWKFVFLKLYKGIFLLGFMRKRDFYFLAGVLFVLLQVVTVVRNVLIDYIYFFWLCDFVLVLYALGFFLKNDQFVKGIVNLGLIPQIIYFVNVLILIFFGVSFFEGIDFLLGVPPFIILLTLLFHSSTFFAFFFTYKIKPSKISIYYSLVGVILVYLLVFLFSNPMDNPNYVFLFSDLFGAEKFSIFWIPVVFLFIVLPTQLFQYFVWKVFSRNASG